MKKSMLKKQYPHFYKKTNNQWYFFDGRCNTVQFTNAKHMPVGYFFINGRCNFEVFEEKNLLLINKQIALHTQAPLSCDNSLTNCTLEDKELLSQVRASLDAATSGGLKYLSSAMPVSYNDDYVILNHCCLIKLIK